MKQSKKGRANPSKMACNTKDIVLSLRVTYEEWRKLLQQCGGKGRLSQFIREKLGLEARRR